MAGWQDAPIVQPAGAAAQGQAAWMNAPVVSAAPQERGIGAAIYDNLIGNPNDGVQSYGEQLGTWLNRAGESMTLGVVGDEASAAATGMLPGRSYGGELDRYRANEAGMSTLGGLSADIAGALVPGIGTAGLIARAPTALGRIGVGAATGGAMGAVQGFAEGEGGSAERLRGSLSGAGIGSALGGAIPAIGAGIGSVAKGNATRRMIRQAGRNAPTSEALRAEGNALYQQIDDAGVQIRPEAFSRARESILNSLRANTGFDELPGPGSLTPNTSRVVQIMDAAGDKMAQDPTAALPFRSLDQMRRQAGAAAGNITNKSDQRAGVEVIKQLDDFVQTLSPDDVIEGSDVATLQSAIGKARDVWSRMSRSQTVDDAIGRSENYLSGPASGIRNQFKNILQNKKLSAQFTDAERAALRQVTNGGALNQIINLAGGGLAQIGAIGGGLAVGGPAGGIAGAVLAAGQRKLAEATTMRAAEAARSAIASGALRNPAILQALETAGKRPEMITNSVLNALMATSRQ